MVTFFAQWPLKYLLDCHPCWCYSLIALFFVTQVRIFSWPTGCAITCATGPDGQLPVPGEVIGGGWGSHATQALTGVAVCHAVGGRRCLWGEVVQTSGGLREALRQGRGRIWWPWLTFRLILCLIFPQKQPRFSQCRALRQGEQFVQGYWLMAHMGHRLNVPSFRIFIHRLFTATQGVQQRQRQPGTPSFCWRKSKEVRSLQIISTLSIHDAESIFIDNHLKIGV